MDLERVDDVNLSRRSAFVSGKLTGVWGDQSIANVSITPKQGYDALREFPGSRFAGPVGFPDLLEDGSLSMSASCSNKPHCRRVGVCIYRNIDLREISALSQGFITTLWIVRLSC